MRKLHFIPLVILSLIACEKVIEVDLNTADPKTVIDASICAQDSVHVIFISESGRFTDAEGLARVSGAVAILKDQNGIEGTFTELDSGIYFLQNFPLIDGNTYELNVTRGDELITASSFLNPQITLDSIFFEENEFGGSGGPGGNDPERTKYRISVVFQDPGNIENFYRLIMTVNDTVDKTFVALTDDLTNGNERSYRYRSRNVFEGDEVDMELWTIDRSGYDYFETLADIASDGGFASATPYNPITNLSSGLGSFTVYNRSRISGMVIP